MNPMKVEFHESITIYDDSQLENIWSNTLLKQCISRTTQAFQTNHNPIHFAFNYVNHITQFQQIKQLLTIQPPKEDKALMQYTTCFVLVKCGGVGTFVVHTTFPSSSHCVPQHIPNSSSLYSISFALSSPLVTYINNPQGREYNMSILGYFFSDYTKLIKFLMFFFFFWGVMGQSKMSMANEKKLNFEAPDN